MIAFFLLDRKELFGVPFLNYIAFALLLIGALLFAYWFLKMLIISARAFVYGHFVIVSAVVDGDTFRCRPVLTNRRRKKSLTVRLIGLDTPESVKSRNKDIAPHGIESSDYSKKRLSKGKFLILLQDVDTIDHYGRELAYAYTIWGELFNATLIKKGMAWAYRYPPNVRHAEYFDRLNAEAKDKKLGLWKMYEAPNVLSSKYKKSSEFKNFVKKYGNPSQLGG